MVYILKKKFQAKNKHMELLRKSIKIGISGIVYDSAPPIRILLMRREKEPFKNKWTFPGGHLEFGESIHDAIKREVFEETGYKVFVPSSQHFVHSNEMIAKDSHTVVFSAYCVLSIDDMEKLDDKLDKKTHNNIEHKFFYLDRRDDPQLPYFDDLKDEDCIPNLKEIHWRFYDRYILPMGVDIGNRKK